jgi:hypothetical protein
MEEKEHLEWGDTGKVRQRRRSLARDAIAAAVAVLAAVVGIALQHHTPGQASDAGPDPRAPSYPGSAVFDNQPVGPDPPAAPYPGSAVFDNQPAARWWTATP